MSHSMDIDDDQNDGAQPISPGSKFSVLSTTATNTGAIGISDNEDNMNNYNNMHQRIATDTTTPRFIHKLSVGTAAQSSSTPNLADQYFMRSSRKYQTATTMFDMDIAKMMKRGTSLERIYYDSQKFRGATKKSMRLTAKMRSISYSPNISRVHSRRNTAIDTYTPTLTKKDLCSQSTPNYLPLIQPECSLNDTKSVPTRGSTDNTVTLIDDDETETVREISNDSRSRNDSYSAKHISQTTDSITETNENNKIKPNVRILSMDPINITVPEDAVLTPEKDTVKRNHSDIDSNIIKLNKDDMLPIIDDDTEISIKILIDEEEDYTLKRDDTALDVMKMKDDNSNISNISLSQTYNNDDNDLSTVQQLKLSKH
eukprot:288846_1